MTTIDTTIEFLGALLFALAMGGTCYIWFLFVRYLIQSL
jgi:hypothetical protein